MKTLKNSRIFTATTVPSSGSRGHNCCCCFTENPFKKRTKKKRNASKFQHCARTHSCCSLTLSLFTRKTPVAIHFSHYIFLSLYPSSSSNSLLRTHSRAPLSLKYIFNCFRIRYNDKKR